MHSYSPLLILLHSILTGDEIRNHCTFIAKGANVDPFTRANSQYAIHITQLLLHELFWFLSEYRCKDAYTFYNIGAQPDDISTIFENNNRKGQMRRAHFSNLIATELASGLPAYAFTCRPGMPLVAHMFLQGFFKTCTNSSSTSWHMAVMWPLAEGDRECWCMKKRRMFGSPHGEINGQCYCTESPWELCVPTWKTEAKKERWMPPQELFFYIPSSRGITIRLFLFGEQR